jgi:hypothetical protein
MESGYKEQSLTKPLKVQIDCSHKGTDVDLLYPVLVPAQVLFYFVLIFYPELLPTCEDHLT